MIEVNVNGRTVALPAPLTVKQLLEQLGYVDDFVAVALDRTHVPRREFSVVEVHAGAVVDVLAPMAGG